MSVRDNGLSKLGVLNAEKAFLGPAQSMMLAKYKEVHRNRSQSISMHNDSINSSNKETHMENEGKFTTLAHRESLSYKPPNNRIVKKSSLDLKASPLPSFSNKKRYELQLADRLRIQNESESDEDEDEEDSEEHHKISHVHPLAPELPPIIGGNKSEFSPVKLGDMFEINEEEKSAQESIKQNASLNDENLENNKTETIKADSSTKYQPNRQPLDKKFTLGRTKAITKEQKTLQTRDLLKLNYFVILPDDYLRRKWDIVVVGLLLYTAIITTFRISFYDEDSVGWYSVDWIVDFLYAFDILLNFLTAYYEDDILIKTRKKIAMNYLKSWFVIDLIGIFPIYLIENIGRDYNSLARIMRLPRLYRLLKMTKLMRMLKIIRHRKKVVKIANESFKMDLALERIFYSILIFIVVCHITACMWYLLAKLENFPQESWVVKHGFQDLSPINIYLTSFYFTVTTITTVGYGDISAGTVVERTVAIFLMIFGVIAYSYSISAISSVISSIDYKNVKLNEKLKSLEQIRVEYNLDPNFYIKLKKALKYDHSKNYEDKLKFVNELPQKLRHNLSVIIHQKIITKISFFQNRHPQFITFVAPMLRPVMVPKGDLIYSEGEPIEESMVVNNILVVFFLVEGSAALVLREYNDLPYVYIDPGYYFGEADILDDNLRRNNSIKAFSDCELLALSKEDLCKVGIHYPEIFKELMKNAEKRIERAEQIKEKAILFAQHHSATNKFNAAVTKAQVPIPGSMLATQTSTREKSKFSFGRSLGEIDDENEDEMDDQLYNVDPSKPSPLPTTDAGELEEPSSSRSHSKKLNLSKKFSKEKLKTRSADIDGSACLRKKKTVHKTFSADALNAKRTAFYKRNTPKFMNKNLYQKTKSIEGMELINPLQKMRKVLGKDKDEEKKDTITEEEEETSEDQENENQLNSGAEIKQVLNTVQELLRSVSKVSSIRENEHGHASIDNMTEIDLLKTGKTPGASSTESNRQFDFSKSITQLGKNALNYSNNYPKFSRTSSTEKLIFIGNAPISQRKTPGSRKNEGTVIESFENSQDCIGSSEYKSDRKLKDND